MNLKKIYYISCHTLENPETIKYGKARLTRDLIDMWVDSKISFGGLEFKSDEPALSQSAARLKISACLFDNNFVPPQVKFLGFVSCFFCFIFSFEGEGRYRMLQVLGFTGHHGTSSPHPIWFGVQDPPGPDQAMEPSWRHICERATGQHLHQVRCEVIACQCWSCNQLTTGDAVYFWVQLVFSQIWCLKVRLSTTGFSQVQEVGAGAHGEVSAHLAVCASG